MTLTRTALLSVAIVAIGGAATAQRVTKTPMYGYQVVRAFPHDPEAFTQGLVFLDGVLYEGTGLNGRSSIRKVKLENGEVLQIQKIPSRYFGEGIAVWGNTLVQLTWQSEVGFVYDKTTFQRKKTFTYKGEGWGLAYDGTRLAMTDGSAFIRFLDPNTFAETGRLLVKDGAAPVQNLNEIEFVKGEIFANVWQTERIARISPKTGQVTGWIDLHGLLNPAEAANVDVLNGIAYDAAKDRLFVTGKLWPRLFEIKIVPRS